MEREIMCARCGVKLEQELITFEYFGHKLQKEIPCCPLCGQAYVSPELAAGKMLEAEMEMEDK